jgi:hypothetical protein
VTERPEPPRAGASRPPRIRPTTGPRAHRPPPPSRSSHTPGSILRAAGGASLAVAAVALGIGLLLVATSEDPDDGDSPVVAAEPPPVQPPPSESGFVPPPPLPLPLNPPPVGEELSGAEEVEPPSGEVAPVSEVTVTVLQQPDTGLAEPMAATLRRTGWAVGFVGNYRGQPLGATTVFHVEGREQEARRLAAEVGATRIAVAPSTLRGADLTLTVESG